MFSNRDCDYNGGCGDVDIDVDEDGYSSGHIR